MTAHKSAEIEQYTIVLLGHFNPPILNPDWLARYELVRPEEVEEREVEVHAITSDVAIFRASWLRLQVTREKFVARTMDPEHRFSLCDLVSKLFSVLDTTPLTALGMNTERHFQVASREAADRIGDTLAPKDVWKEVLRGGARAEVPGLRSLVMEGQREAAASEFVRVTVQPSTRVVPGVYIASNEQFVPPAGADGGEGALGFLTENWSDALKFSARICEHILAIGDSQ